MTSPRFGCLGACALAVLFSATIPAQRDKPEFEWGGRSLILDYGRPSFGRHSLDELVPGEPWRLGSNEASTLLVEMPLLSKSAMVAPGHYRVKLYRDRRDGDRLYLQIDGGGWGMGTERKVEYLGASIGDAALSKKLQIRWVPRGDGQAGSGEPVNTDVVMEIRFGPHQVDVPMTVLGSRPEEKVGRYTLTAFTVPADVLEARMKAGRPTVVATLVPRKKVSGRVDPPFFNLILESSRASLVPAQRAPVDSFGFAELVAYDAAWTSEAEMEWVDREASTPLFEISELSEGKKQLSVTCMFGKKLGAVTLDLPSKPKR